MNINLDLPVHRAQSTPRGGGSSRSFFRGRSVRIFSISFSIPSFPRFYIYTEKRCVIKDYRKKKKDFSFPLSFALRNEARSRDTDCHRQRSIDVKIVPLPITKHTATPFSVAFAVFSPYLHRETLIAEILMARVLYLELGSKILFSFPLSLSQFLMKTE